MLSRSRSLSSSASTSLSDSKKLTEMKKIYFFLFLSVFVLNSCEEDLNLAPISSAGSNGFYQTQNDFTQALNGVYGAFGVQNNVDYPSFYVNLNETRSDNIYSPGQAGVRDWNNINNLLSTLSTLATLKQVWNTTFNAIMRANTLLDKIKENPDAVTDAALRSRMEAEARFLRAYFYFDLVKWFGKVPVFTTFTTPDEALKIGRSPVSEVYDLIISDLKFAIEKLPATYAAADKGRATSMAAKGILARVYLMRSGPQLHPDGPCLASKEYSLALALINDIISSGQFSLQSSYAKIFDYANEGNSEIVWDLQFISGGQAAGAYYPTEYYDEAWGRVNLPFAGGNPGDGNKTISSDLVSSYDAADQRLAATGIFEYKDATGATVSTAFFSKFINKTKAGSDRFEWAINYPVIRYADVLLMKAECILQGASGTQAEVDALVNQVRARAGLAATSNVNLDMLLNERRKEFAGENLRWEDLVRTGKVIDVMNAWRAKVDTGGKIQPMKSDFIIYPIPQEQLDVKKGLYTQNQGYL